MAFGLKASIRIKLYSPPDAVAIFDVELWIGPFQIFLEERVSAVRVGRVLPSPGTVEETQISDVIRIAADHARQLGRLQVFRRLLLVPLPFLDLLIRAPLRRERRRGRQDRGRQDQEEECTSHEN